MKGRELANEIEKVDPGYTVINDRIDSFSRKDKDAATRIPIRRTIFLCFYFLIVNMILPIIPGIKD